MTDRPERMLYTLNGGEEIEVVPASEVERVGAELHQVHLNYHHMVDEAHRLRAALRRAHEQLSKHDCKGPKQIGRAMMTIEGVMPELARAFDEEDR